MFCLSFMSLFHLSSCDLTRACAPFERLPSQLTFRVLTSPPIKKRLFFIRHGQSEWNKATEETYMLHKMMALDHPLSSRGIDEASALRDIVKRGVEHQPGLEMAEVRVLCVGVWLDCVRL